MLWKWAGLWDYIAELICLVLLNSATHGPIPLDILLTLYVVPWPWHLQNSLKNLAIAMLILKLSIALLPCTCHTWPHEVHGYNKIYCKNSNSSHEFLASQMLIRDFIRKQGCTKCRRFTWKLKIATWSRWLLLCLAVLWISWEIHSRWHQKASATLAWALVS